MPLYALVPIQKKSSNNVFFANSQYRSLAHIMYLGLGSFGHYTCMKPIEDENFLFNDEKVEIIHKGSFFSKFCDCFSR